MEPLPPEVYQEQFLGLLQQAQDRRVREAIGQGVYPTAWGCQWSREVWDSDAAKRCLSFWLDQATKRVLAITH